MGLSKHVFSFLVFLTQLIDFKSEETHQHKIGSDFGTGLQEQFPSCSSPLLPMNWLLKKQFRVRHLFIQALLSLFSLSPRPLA